MDDQGESEDEELDASFLDEPWEIEQCDERVAAHTLLSLCQVE